VLLLILCFKENVDAANIYINHGLQFGVDLFRGRILGLTYLQNMPQSILNY